MSYNNEDRLQRVKARAEGRWTSILENIGVDPAILNRRNQPCPGCGGENRFQYTDKFHLGDYFCRGCGHGDGFQLASMALGLSFGEVLRLVEREVGGDLPPIVQSEPNPDKMRALAKRIWEEAHPIVQGDEVDRYLRGRGLVLDRFPSVLRFHPSLAYFVKDKGKSKKVAEYPAMLACIQSESGKFVTVHRTYLSDAAKADVDDVKKLLSSGIKGGAVRLGVLGPELAVAEGIEKSLAVTLATGKPCWALINCQNMEKFWSPPPEVRKLVIYSDNDEDSCFDGEASAYALARRVKKAMKLSGSEIEVKVYRPKKAGEDVEDVYRRKVKHLQAA